MPRAVVLLLFLGLACSWQPLSVLAQDAPPALSLTDALAQARTVSPQRRAAHARLQAAEGSLHQAGRLPNPSLDLRQENLELGGNSRQAIDRTVDAFAVLNQLIEVGGKRAARAATASAGVSEAQALLAQTEREVTLEVARSYLGALQYYTLAAVLRQHLAELQPLVAALQRRVEEGYAAEADLMKLQLEPTRLEAQLVSAETRFAEAAATLATLLDAPGAIDGARLVMPEPLAPPVGDPTTLARRAVERHPEILAARARVEQARQTLALEKARRLPDPTITAGYKRANGRDTLVTALVVPLPVFDQNAGNIERAAAEERAATAELDSLYKRQLAATATQIRSAQMLAARAQQLHQRLRQFADVVRTASRSAFHEGAIDIFRFAEAERSYAETQRDALALDIEAYEKAFIAHTLMQEGAQP